MNQPTDDNARLRETINKLIDGNQWVFIPDPPLPSRNGIIVPAISRVPLSITDFYKAGSAGKKTIWALHAEALLKFGTHAGVDWTAGIGMAGRTDDRKNKNYCSFRSCGRIRTSSGLWLEMSAGKAIDLDAKRASIEEKHKKNFFFSKRDAEAGKVKWGKKVKAPWPNDEAEFVKANTDKELNPKRENIEENCETGSQARVIKKLLNLQAAFIGNENEPFCLSNQGFYVVKYILDPTNQNVQMAQLNSLTLAQRDIYGTELPAQKPRLVQGPETDQGKTITVNAHPKEKHQVQSGGFQGEDSEVIDFENCDIIDQCKIIQDLAEKKQYPNDLMKGDFKGRPELPKWSQDDRTGYFKHIKNEEWKNK